MNMTVSAYILNTVVAQGRGASVVYNLQYSSEISDQKLTRWQKTR